MSRASSPSAAGRYGTARVCRVWEVPRSTVYARRARASRTAQPAAKRGPKQAWTDAALTEQIRSVLAGSPFIGEGYRKARARLRLAGVRTSKGRVLRLMREAGLLAPTRVGRRRGPRNHDGTITTDRPDELWGTDATACLTTREGNATVFIAVDHCTQECVGIHAARPGTRFEALEPLRQGLREHFGGYGAGVATGLALRHDHGSQYMSDHFQGELRFLGIRSSPSFVAAPEGNGCAERFIRTLKEQLLWVETFETVEQLRLALLAFKDRYNEAWLVERHGHRTPPPFARRSRRAPERPHDYRLRGVQESGSGTLQAFEISTQTAPLQDQVAAFAEQVSRALDQLECGGQVRDHVRDLEERYDALDPSTFSAAGSREPGFPDSDEIVGQIEEFLRQQANDAPSDEPSSTSG